MTFSYAWLPGVLRRCERLLLLFCVLWPYKSRVRYGGRYKELNICRTSKNNPIPLLVLTLVIKMSANCFAMFSNFNLFLVLSESFEEISTTWYGRWNYYIKFHVSKTFTFYETRNPNRRWKRNAIFT